MNKPTRPRGKRIALCGTRGVPARYGGFETTVEEISRRLVKSGYNCTVFCRGSAGEERPTEHEGRKLVYVGGSSLRELDTFVSAWQTGLHLLLHRKEYDFVFWFNNANLPGILLTLLARIPMSVNTDGLEWRRAKWKWPFKAYYFLASFMIARLCGSLISDSIGIQTYYKEVFAKDTHFVPYGTPQKHTVPPDKQSSVLDEYGLEPGRYLLQVTRFEPENLPLESALAFRDAGLAQNGFKLLLVGYQQDHPYARRVKSMSGTDGVLVTDATYDAEVLSVLRENCFCYVHGNSVGGTNPALLEAMATCPRILAVDVQFSREVLGNTAHFFDPHDMATSFRGVTDHPDMSAALRERVHTRYQWDAVAQSYTRLAEGHSAAYSTPSVSTEAFGADRTDQRISVVPSVEDKDDLRWPSRRLGATGIMCLSFSEAVRAICELAADDRRGNIVVTPNIQHVVELEHNAAFREAYSSASLVLPDGWPIVAAMRLLGTPCPERVPGSDLLPVVSMEAANRGLTVGFMGGLPEAATKAAAKLVDKYPKLRVTVVHEAPVGFDRSPDSAEAVVAAVAAAAPDILFVALGAPRQEMFALQHRERLGAGVIVGVGAAIDFAAELRPRAPRILRKFGLEWLFRVAIEPKRLGPRYARAAPKFAWIVLRQSVNKWIAGEKDE